jgi:uncharacterized membrane protein YfcA
MAACQIFQHASKVMLFGLRGFALERYLLPCSWLCLAAIAGSAIGTRLLDHMPEKPFKFGVRLVLSALALEQLWQGLSGLLHASGLGPAPT